MKISFERTGGFAGMRVAVSVDSQNLPAQDAAALAKMVNDAGFFNLPEHPTAQGRPDGFQYTISIDSDGKQRTMQIVDGSLPAALQPLVNDLILRARTQKRAG